MFEKMRGTWTKAIQPLVERMGDLDPSVLTWTSLFVSLIGFYILSAAEISTNGAIMIVVAVILVLVAGVLDALDGALARHQGTDGAYGDFLDHTIDRIVDVGLLVAIGMNTAFVSMSAIWSEICVYRRQIEDLRKLDVTSPCICVVCVANALVLVNAV